MDVLAGYHFFRHAGEGARELDNDDIATADFGTDHRRLILLERLRGFVTKDNLRISFANATKRSEGRICAAGASDTRDNSNQTGIYLIGISKMRYPPCFSKWKVLSLNKCKPRSP